jgi:hypothetical protein
MFPVYRYEDRNMLWDPVLKTRRLLTATECERLMGIDSGYTLACAKEKFGSRHVFIDRMKLIGNSFNCGAVAFLVAQLCSVRLPNCQWDPQTFVKAGVCQRPYAARDREPHPEATDAHAVQLAKEFLRIAEKGGSDIRLDIGMPFRPNAWPRAGARVGLWSWKCIHGYPWKNEAHINKLELLAAVNAVQWRTRKAQRLCSRFIHLVDSQVVGAILTKGRTSSRALRSTVRRYNALVVAAQLYPAYIFAASEDNPADIPSRWKFHAKKRASANGYAGGTGARKNAKFKKIFAARRAVASP